jgi:fructokinase
VTRLGIDLGGTKIEGIVLDGDGREVARRRLATVQAEGYEAILARIAGLVADLHSAAGGRACTLGFGTPGALSLRTGLLKNSNTLCLNGKPLKADLERLLARPVAIQNDANCFAMAEALFGAGQRQPLVFGVIMGTGCGGGIVHNGAVITGRQAIAGEWGHTSIDPAGPACYCGRRGCVETFISGGGLSKLDDLYTQGRAEVARRIFSDSLETPIVRNRLGDSAGVIGAALIGV